MNLETLAPIAIFVLTAAFFAGRYIGHKNSKPGPPKITPAPVIDMAHLVTDQLCDARRMEEKLRWETLKEDVSYIHNMVEKMREKP